MRCRYQSVTALPDECLQPRPRAVVSLGPLRLETRGRTPSQSRLRPVPSARDAYGSLKPSSINLEQ
jgi:hypothetical protein